MAKDPTKADDRESAAEGEPSESASAPGVTDAPAGSPAQDEPMAMPPAPGVPVSAEEYRRLKKRAAEMPDGSDSSDDRPESS